MKNSVKFNNSFNRDRDIKSTKNKLNPVVFVFTQSILSPTLEAGYFLI